MDNNSNHTSIFVDTRRYAKHFECIVWFNPQQRYEAVIFFFFNLCGWKLKLSEAKQFAPNHTAKWRSKILHTSTVIWGGGGQQGRVTDSWQDGQTGRPEGSLLNQALSRGQ